jgi:hypothetical protein
MLKKLGLFVFSLAMCEAFSMSSDRYASFDAYVANCRRFSEEFSVTTPQDVPTVFASGFDFSKVVCISARSIINGVFKGNDTRRRYFLTMLRKENIPLLQNEFEKILDESTFVENGTAYKKYVFDTVRLGLPIRKYRENIVMFLAALRYRKTIFPSFQVIFNRVDKFNETFLGDKLVLQLELKNGKHHTEVSPDTHVNFTLPDLFFQCRPLYQGVTTSKNIRNDTYIVGHELGHAAHDMLGINAPRISFNRYVSNDFVRNAFFPLIDRVRQEYMDTLLFGLKMTIAQKISSGEYADKALYFSAKLNEIKAAYRSGEIQYDDEEAEISGIADVQRSIDAGNFDDDFLKRAICLQMKYNAYGVWTNPEEMFQIVGLAFCNGQITVNCVSDLDLFVTCLMPFRWFHLCSDVALIQKNDPYSFLNLAPSADHVTGLLYLHGYDFSKYKSAMDFRWFSLDRCWIQPYTSLSDALKKMYEMGKSLALK